MPGERVDNLTPNALLKDIEIRWRLRATPTRDTRNNGQRS
jgi:hypothetical protein